MKWGIVAGEMNRVMQSGDCVPGPVALGELFWFFGGKELLGWEIASHLFPQTRELLTLFYVQGTLQGPLINTHHLFFKQVQLTGLICMAENFTTIVPTMAFSPQSTWKGEMLLAGDLLISNESGRVRLESEDLICTVFLSYCQLNTYIST